MSTQDKLNHARDIVRKVYTGQTSDAELGKVLDLLAEVDRQMTLEPIRKAKQYRFKATGHDQWGDGTAPEHVEFTVKGTDQRDAKMSARDWIVSHCNTSLRWDYELIEELGQ